MEQFQFIHSSNWKHTRIVSFYQQITIDQKLILIAKELANDEKCYGFSIASNCMQVYLYEEKLPEISELHPMGSYGMRYMGIFIHIGRYNPSHVTKIGPGAKPGALDIVISNNKFQFFPMVCSEFSVFTCLEGNLEDQIKNLASDTNCFGFSLFNNNKRIALYTKPLPSITQFVNYDPTIHSTKGIYVHVVRYNSTHIVPISNSTFSAASSSTSVNSVKELENKIDDLENEVKTLNDKIKSLQSVEKVINSETKLTDIDRSDRFKFFPDLYLTDAIGQSIRLNDSHAKYIEERITYPNCIAYTYSKCHTFIFIIIGKIPEFSQIKKASEITDIPIDHTYFSNGVYIHIDRYNATHTEQIERNPIKTNVEKSSTENNLNDLVKAFYDMIITSHSKSDNQEWFIVEKDDMDKLVLFNGLNEVKCWFVDQVKLLFVTDVQTKFSSYDELCRFIKYQIKNLN